MTTDSFRRYRRFERQHPIFSPVALISTLLLALGLGVGLYTTGGRAFSPGELSAVNHSGLTLAGVTSHAEIVDDCGQCHEPFVGIAAERCQRCHTEIGVQRQDETALHGRLENVAACEHCHLEHRGADYDLKTAAVAEFDHDLTSFTLARHGLDFDGRPLECTSCHLQEGRFTIDQKGCTDCHRAEDGAFMKIHEKGYGQDCLACHDGKDTMADFTLDDHMELFPLTGAHLVANCETCHRDGQFADLPQECAGCHMEPDKHLGMFSADCAECHISTEWVPAAYYGFAFDHQLSTRFSLVRHETDFSGAPFTCTSCHLPKQPVAIGDPGCLDCHQPEQTEFMATHTDQFGNNCQSCHDGSGNMTHFDHNDVWPLEGMHLQMECNVCHVDQVFSGTPRQCVACHEEPPIHLGIFGVTCNNCHTSEGWLPARLRQHTYPLDHGGQGQLDCTACHQAETYTVYDCTTCHEHEPTRVEAEHEGLDIPPEELFDCASCHATSYVEE